MGTNIFPSLPGEVFPVQRSPVWDTITQTAISGKETRIAKQTYPRYKWEIGFSILRAQSSLQEFQELMGFFNDLQGGYDTFLYTDVTDNSVTAQAIGTGNASQTNFQLVRTFGYNFTFVEPVLAPNTITGVYLNGVLQSGSTYTVYPWGTSNAAGPGVIVFNTAPGSGVAITATFSYYWPCRMQADSIDFSLIMSQYYELKKFSFISVKN